MTKLFERSRTIEIVRDTLTVNNEGAITFRCRVGRGSGKAIEIPADQFDEFVDLMQETQTRLTEVENQDISSLASDDSEEDSE
jgi:hypothetical protein